MLKRLVPCLALLCLVVASIQARAADAATAPPLVIQVQSADGLLGHMKYLADLKGEGLQAGVIEGLVRSTVLNVVNAKEPMGLYGTFTTDNPRDSMVLLVPVKDEKAVLDALGNLNLKAEKGEDGIYKMSVPVKSSTVPVYFCFANKYVYVACHKPDVLAKGKVLDPAKLFKADASAVVSLTLHIDQIPDKVKEQAVKHMESHLTKIKEKKKLGHMTEAEKKLLGAILNVRAKEMATVIKEGAELSMRLTIDEKSNDLVVETKLTAKPGTKLAELIADQGKLTSEFAGLVGKDSAFSLLARSVYPKDLTEAIVPFIKEHASTHLEKVKDAAKHEQLAKVMKALEPQLKLVGNSDFAIDVRGPSANKLYTVVAAHNLVDGKALEKQIPDLVKGLPTECQAAIKLNAEKAGDIAIHRIDAQKKKDAKYTHVFGDNPVYIAIRQDAVFVAMGEKGLDALKEALAAKKGPAAPLHMEMSVARLAAMCPDPAVAKAVEALGKEKGADKITLTVEGGKALTMHFDMKLGVVKLANEVHKAAMSEKKEKKESEKPKEKKGEEKPKEKKDKE